MAAQLYVTDRVANTSCRKLPETSQKDHLQPKIFIQKCSCEDAIAHIHSADVNLPDLTRASTILFAFSACVLKFPVQHSAFVSKPPTPHIHTQIQCPAISADNNVRRKSFTKIKISNYFKNVLLLLMDHTLLFKIVVTKCGRIMVGCVM
jgi:hypothetical protein